MISDALILTQNYELSNACDNGRLEDARSAFQRGADPYWRTPNPVSLRLVHSFCVHVCIYSVVSEYGLVVYVYTDLVICCVQACSPECHSAENIVHMRQP